MMRKTLLALVLALSVAAQSANATDSAWAAIERGDLATAVAVWQPLATRGDVNAMLGLAHVASMQGDDAEAADWYRQAAVRGDAAACVLLASAYLEGRGVARDPVRAYGWYEVAAQRGHANAAQARDFAAKWLSPEQVGLARSMIVRWYEDDFANAR
jgi:uncharacterized protein